MKPLSSEWVWSITLHQLTCLSVCLSLRLDNLQQTKARLELSNQTLKQQHGKELEGREEELEQVKVTLNKKLKSVSQQLDEVHEDKQAAVKVRSEWCMVAM